MNRINLQLFAQKLNTDTSIVDYLKSQGQDSSYSARKNLAASLGITNYSGSYDQNVAMLKALKGGSGASSTPKASTAPTNTNVAGSGKSSINGVDKATADKMNSSFAPSANVTSAQAEKDAYLEKVKELGSVTDIIDQSTWDAINKKWEAPTAYNEAFAYTNQLLQQLSSGRTSYTDQIKDLMEQIQNRDKFEYDVDSDVLFQQYLGSAMNSGKTAMMDTIGQASALTGGYGSTYATSAGNQQYNAYIQDAYNNLPEYYQMALEAYQMEGEEMYNQLSMLNQADATEYQRLYDSWNANFTSTQQMYQNAYGEWRDSVGNAISSAGLQLNEYGQLYDQAYKTYSAVADNAQTLYQNEYTKWADEVANAYKYAGLANSDYWSTQNFVQSQKEHDAEMSYKYAALQQDQNQFNASLTQENSQFLSKNDLNGDGVVNSKDLETKSAGNTTESGYKEPSETQMKKALEAYNTGGEDALYQYVDSLGADIDMGLIDSYINQYGQLPLEKRTFTKTKDTYNGGFLGLPIFKGDDNNDVVEDQYGNQYRIDELPESLRSALTKLKENESYTAK